ncbi:MAG: cupin domain-containing protein [Candidatus Saccharimonadales bacterium]
MKIIKRSNSEIPKEEAHGGSGSRKVYVSPEHLQSKHFDAMTHGWLPVGSSFDWHDHKDTEEIMVVIKGSGSVFDEDGEYSYKPGDVFIFPANTQHKITNPSNEQHKMFFVRVKV